MLESDSPAGPTGGPVALPVLDALPAKMRVHALARLLGRSSREVLATLGELGVEVRGAQSSIERPVAEQVVAALAPAAGEPSPADGVESAEAVDDTAPLAPVFAPPTPVFQAPARPARPRRRATAAEPEPEVDLPAEPETAAETGETSDDGAEDGEGAGRRRRRRGRRGRGRGRGGDDGDGTDDTEDEGGDEAAEDGADTAADAGAEDADAEGDDEGDAGSRRRRRRRRRRASGDEGEDARDAADPPNTVTRVRQPRESRDDDGGDGVQSVRGSTRLEAKRQRRRDGRDAGRRRVPILSEAEFLARREAVDRSMVVRQRGDRVEIGVLEDDVLVEHFVTGAGPSGKSLVGNIYLGRVQNVLPSMEAAFVDIGRGRNAVLYAGEVDWDAAGLGGKARRIEQALSSGDSVLVQVTKDPIGHKGARLTTQISLAGRFLVYVPSGGAAGISRKLPDVERKRLKDMLKEFIPSEAGVIIRTASEGVSHDALERDVRRLQAQWEVVKSKADATGPAKAKAPALLYEEPDLLIKVVRDHFNEDFSKLVVSGDDAWETVSNYVGHVAPELVDRLHRHVGPSDVFTEYRIDEQLLKALDRKVWLPSGGTLVIDRTEAMTVIDVNTGKFTGAGGNLEETVTRNNLEAAEEVVRQLRLRDIGGIIVIDFIDMVLEANRDLVLRRLTECLARDRTRHQVAEVTSLGLVQMTRKRVGSGLLEHFATTCEHCRGRGVLVTADLVPEQGDVRAPERVEREPTRRSPRGGRGRRGEVEQEARAELPPGPVAADPVEASVSTGAAAPAASPESTGTLEAAHDEVEEVVVERELAARAEPTRGEEAPGPAGDPDSRVDLPGGPIGNGHAPERGRNGHTSPPRQRRGRVTRTAGAPTVAGAAPVVAVVTVPAASESNARDEGAEPGTAVSTDSLGPADSAPPAVRPAEIPPQPEPSAVSRPRRVRRAASRPAGPPAAEEGGDAGDDPA